MLNFAAMDALAPKLHFWQTRLWVYLLLTLLVKLVLAYFLPITGDEAYFILWGNHPDYGYYDHPPMAGWLLTAMLSVSDAPLWLRLPQILLTSFIGLAIYLLLRRTHEAVAVAVAVLYLLAPVNVLGVLTTTDTPLIFWSFLSAISFYLAQRRDNPWWYLLTGLFLGLAFFSKFFAGLLGVAYFLYIVLYTRRGVRPYLGLLLIVAGTLPFIGLNLWWNYNNCWNNYLFNLVNRNEGAGFSLKTMLIYLVMLVYLVTPPILYYLIRQGAAFKASLTSRQSVFGGLFLIPVALFFLLSFWKVIGLHWLLSFYPFLFLALAPILTTQQLRKCLYFMLPFSVLHLVIAGALLALTPGIAKEFGDKTYRDAVFYIHTEAIIEAMSEYESATLMTESYSKSALLAYKTHQHVPVFSASSYHGREADKLTDFRKLDGRDIVIFSYHRQEKYRPYFRESEIRRIDVEETHFYLFVGRGFDYQTYRDEILREVVEHYYQIPDYLPVGQCYMYERYGFR